MWTRNRELSPPPSLHAADLGGVLTPGATTACTNNVPMYQYVPVSQCTTAQLNHSTNCTLYQCTIVASVCIVLVYHRTNACTTTGATRKAPRQVWASNHSPHYACIHLESSWTSLEALLTLAIFNLDEDEMRHVGLS